MKTLLLRPLAASLAALLVASTPALNAQEPKNEGSPPEESPKEKGSDNGERKKEGAQEKDKDKEKEKEKEKEKPGDDPSSDEESDEEEFDLEQFKERSEAREKQTTAEIAKMMRVFKPLEGEWTGTEKVEHAETKYKGLDKSWHDEWKGFYGMGGRYFEMTGETSGDQSSVYRWICTWDTERKVYKTWYFGDTGTSYYAGRLSDDGQRVMWTRREQTGAETHFEMKPDGDRVKVDGRDLYPGGALFSRQSFTYTRKRVDI